MDQQVHIIHYLIAAVPVGLFAWWVSRSNKRRDKRLGETVVAAARRRGGGRVADDDRVLPMVEFHNGPLLIRAWAKRMGKSESTHVIARFVTRYGPKFTVKPRGTFSGSARKLGENAKFDDRFVIECDDLEETRVVWTNEAQELMFELGDRTSFGEAWIGAIDGRVVSDGEMIEFSRTNAYKSVEAYDAAFRLVAILAGAPLGSLDAAARSGR